MAKPLPTNRTLPSSELEPGEADIVEKLREHGRPLVLTRGGKPSAVVMEPAGYERLTEAARFIAAVTEGLADSDAGHLVSDEDLEQELAAEFGNPMSCLPHASTNPPIHLNAAGVLMELGEADAALTELVRAARRGVDLQPHLDADLLSPLRQHPHWPELEAATRAPETRFELLLARAGVPDPPAVPHPFCDWLTRNPMGMARRIHPSMVVTALALALDDDDARIRQPAARQLMLWLHATGEDLAGRLPPEWMQTWYRQIGQEIEQHISPTRLAEVIARDLRGDFVHEAAHSLSVLSRIHGWSREVGAVLDVLGPVMQSLLGTSDPYIENKVADAVAHFLGNPQCPDSIHTYCLPRVMEMVEESARQGCISDFPTAKRELLWTIVRILAKVDVRPVAPALARLAAAARGDFRDESLRDRIVTLLEKAGAHSDAPAPDNRPA